MTGACDSEVQKSVEVPQDQYLDRVVDVPVVLQRHVRTTHTAQETVEVLQSLIEWLTWLW